MGQGQDLARGWDGGARIFTGCPVSWSRFYLQNKSVLEKCFFLFDFHHDSQLDNQKLPKSDLLI